jgi:hypothetical protein
MKYNPTQGIVIDDKLPNLISYVVRTEKTSRKYRCRSEQKECGYWQWRQASGVHF